MYGLITQKTAHNSEARCYHDLRILPTGRDKRVGDYARAYAEMLKSDANLRGSSMCSRSDSQSLDSRK